MIATCSTVFLVLFTIWLLAVLISAGNESALAVTISYAALLIVMLIFGDWVTIIRTSIFDVLKWSGIFLAIGIPYTCPRWFYFVWLCNKKLVACRNNFMNDNNIKELPIPGAYRAKWDNELDCLNHNEWLKLALKDGSTEVELPRILDYLDRAWCWLLTWPVDAPVMIVRGPVKEFFEFLMRKFGRFYNWLGSLIWNG